MTPTQQLAWLRSKAPYSTSEGDRVHAEIADRIEALQAENEANAKRWATAESKRQQAESDLTTLQAENERLREAVLPLCAYGIEEYGEYEGMPEGIEDDSIAIWEWRISTATDDEYLTVEMFVRDIRRARKALEQK
jgi:hypothetical protein